MKIKIFIAILLTMLVVSTGINRRNIEDIKYFTEKVQVKPNISSILDACIVTWDGVSFGSGAAISPNIILVAKHCVETDNVIVTDRYLKEYKAVNVWRSDKYDVAFLCINEKLPYLYLGNMPNILDEVYCIGTPLQSEHGNGCINNITSGIVSNINIDWRRWKNGIITDVAAYPGNSGCPLLDKNFNVIGMMVGCHNRFVGGGDNFWLAEPVTHIKECLKEYNNDRSRMQ